MDKYEDILDDEKIYIDLQDGDEVVKLLLLDSFGIDEDEYVALLDEQEDQMYIFQLDIEGEEAVFTPIEDEDELDEIISIYAELLEEEDEE